jgi:serine/threonine protein kinase
VPKQGGVLLTVFSPALNHPQWDEKAQKYCKYKNGKGHGDVRISYAKRSIAGILLSPSPQLHVLLSCINQWRAPEEYQDLPVDEKIDIWSLGNNFYSILTGVYPFFNITDGDKIKVRNESCRYPSCIGFANSNKQHCLQEMIKDGKTAVIDPRYKDSSYAEAKLVEIIQLCFAYYPEDRPDIHEIWQLLQEAITGNEQWEKEEAQRKVEAEESEKRDTSSKAEAAAEAKAKEPASKGIANEEADKRLKA